MDFTLLSLLILEAYISLQSKYLEIRIARGFHSSLPTLYPVGDDLFHSIVPLTYSFKSQHSLQKLYLESIPKSLFVQQHNYFPLVIFPGPYFPYVSEKIPSWSLELVFLRQIPHNCLTFHLELHFLSLYLSYVYNWSIPYADYSPNLSSIQSLKFHSSPF